MKEKRTLQSVAKIMGAFFRDHRRMPSYAEMVDLFGVKSKSVVHFWINKLIQKGIIEKDETGHLRITKNAFGIPMVGSVQAGFPSPEEEALRDVISMDEYLITQTRSSFLLKVTGDSMIGEGIRKATW
jgi:SOS-response transcriptional repressor LexA